LSGGIASTPKRRWTTRYNNSAPPAPSVFVWLNLFGWTFRPKIVNPDGTERSTKGAEAHYPFITWKVQDEAVDRDLEAIETGRTWGSTSRATWARPGSSCRRFTGYGSSAPRSPRWSFRARRIRGSEGEHEDAV
jgi:hypothetical protein